MTCSFDANKFLDHRTSFYFIFLLFNTKEGISYHMNL